MNPLKQLHTEGQSYWLDFIRRDLFSSGELKQMIEDQGLRGMTSNPTIFEKAISSSSEYDSDIKKFAAQAKSTQDLFELLAIKDIQKALDLLKPIYVSSHAKDGFVSLEVNPLLAYDTEATLAEARRLWKKVNRPNLMIKIPGTKEGLPAIEEATYEGLNINITLLFSIESYKQVVEAYVRGLERRVEKKRSIDKIASVASFFVSRVDTAVDKILDDKIASGTPDKSVYERLLHTAAISNAKLAYAYFEESVMSSRWQKLQEKGAHVQRLLWASTGTKDKRLSDVIYVEQLIGADTVNTMPPQTADAFQDHGRVALTLNADVAGAEKEINSLSEIGIDLDAITEKLQQDGVQSFIKSFEDLLLVVGAKREMLSGNHKKSMVLNLGSDQSAYEGVWNRIETEKWVEKIWSKDATLWKKEEAHQKIIRNSLGWLTVTNTVKQHLGLLNEIASDVKKQKFTHALLLGMGGSSLAPEVLRLTFGKIKGSPDFAILDSTEPASVLERAKRSKPSKTLYIVASKSGSTIEPNSFLAYFYDQVSKVKGDKAGENFIAITDPGTMMEKIAKEKKFRHIVLNPPDIGGRFSALSFFGMLPAAIMRLPLPMLLNQAEKMVAACSPQMPLRENPGVRLGAALGILAKQGRDKVTFFLSKDILSFATWAEQLVAESTGKEGKGILPVESEDIQNPADYGKDRVFVSIRTASDKDAASVKKIKALEKSGHPVIWISLKNKFDLTAELFRWEIATAVAGKFLEIDPFDQPNVQESKDLTKQYLEEFKKRGQLPKEGSLFENDGISVYGFEKAGKMDSLEKIFESFLSQVKPGDYVALLAYLRRDPVNTLQLQSIRHSILKKTRVATTLGFGPRFLHSTGQLHKGGGNNGVFIQITADDLTDLPVPGEPYTFSVLKQAQALGDLSALKKHGRRLIRIHLKNHVLGLRSLAGLLS